MHLSTLAEWLDWIATLHTREIELGLDRIKLVAKRLGVLAPSIPVIIVGGTNGKGSTVAGLEAIYRCAGYHVGCFTSPILYHHREQVRVDGDYLQDAEFCAAFEQVEQARESVSLTPFEYHTLAALMLLMSKPLDILILEVGLGGRLDAVNILDADLAIVTSVAMDHMEWLGNTREAIGYEKAGIFRTQQQAICGDSHPPHSLKEYAHTIGAHFYYQQHDFLFEESSHGWRWQGFGASYDALPIPVLALQNMSTVLAGITLLQARLPVDRKAIDDGLSTVRLPGRFEVVKGEVTQIYDVAHNPAAMGLLADNLTRLSGDGKNYAVFSMLADKDITACLQIMKPYIHGWYTAPLSCSRAASMALLDQAFKQTNIDNVHQFATIEQAFNAVRLQLHIGDRLVVFGSFHTVAAIRSH